jgi:hypothetical protein
MRFDGDAFISYAHLDNVELVEGRKGWVANLHRALEVRVAQLLGKSPQIWRDPKLAGNDLFADTIIERLRRVAILIAVVSPRYLKSEWTLRELTEFWSAAEQQGGVRVRDKARVFKVLKTPVHLEQTPPTLKALLGYEFFKVDAETGKIRELDEVFGPEAQRDFWIRLDDLAHDICSLLEMLEGGPASGSEVVAAVTAGRAPASHEAGQPSAPVGSPAAAVPATAVYLAETTSDLRDQREMIRRDVQQHGVRVLPDRPLPHVADEAEAAIRDDLARCRLSIHFIGRHYGVVPEGGELSLVEMQHELATARGSRAGFARVIWIPDKLDVQDDRQRRVIERLRVDPRVGAGADLFETYFEDMRTAVQDLLRRPRALAPTPATEARSDQDGPPRLYLVADQRDVGVLDPWVDALFDRGFEVIRAVYQGDERDIREDHEENLATCDGVVIFYGSGNELWVRRKLRELHKAAGFGRTKPQPPVAVCLIGARTPEKERFRTHEASVVPQWDGVALGPLEPFVASVRARGA